MKPTTGDTVAMQTIKQLHEADADTIRQIALDKLDALLERCTINLVTQLTRISRPTIYRWLDESLDYEAMDWKDCAWFILVCNTSPKVKMLMDRPPLSHPRLAKRVIEEGEANDERTKRND